MSGPKHLWSGDWQSETTRPAAPRTPVVEQEPEPEPSPARGWNRRQVAIGLYAALAAAAVTVALVTSLGGSSKPKQRLHGAQHAAAPKKGNSTTSGGRGLTTSNQTTASNPYGPSANWLGMQIDSTPNGIYIDAMNTSGAADAAGLEPGDQIVAIDNHDINTVRDIQSDTKGLKLGAPVEITVMRSSVQVQSQLIPMMQRPTIHP